MKSLLKQQQIKGLLWLLRIGAFAMLSFLRDGGKRDHLLLIACWPRRTWQQISAANVGTTALLLDAEIASHVRFSVLNVITADTARPYSFITEMPCVLASSNHCLQPLVLLIRHLQTVVSCALLDFVCVSVIMN